MGPRSFDRGNEELEIEQDAIAALQWGRDRSIAEIRRLLPSLHSLRGFNGAAIVRSRKWARLTTRCSINCRLQWGRDRSIAEIWKFFSRFRWRRSFNGAAI